MILQAARVVSTLSHPVVVFPASVPFFLAQAQLTREQIFMLGIILFILFLPIAYFFYAFKRKKISDWDVTKKEERRPIYLLSLLCGGVALFLLQFFESPTLVSLALTFYLLGILVTIINFFWKISAHAAGVTAGALVFNLLLGQSPYLYFLIPLVAWSRYREKEHTPAQIFAGVLLGATVVLAVLIVRTGVSS